MNKIFKVIWSKTKGCYIVVSEIAKNQSKSGKRRARDLALAAIVGVGVAMSTGVGVVHAEVTDAQFNEVKQDVSTLKNQVGDLNNWKNSVQQNGGISGGGTGSGETPDYATKQDVADEKTRAQGAEQANATAAENAQTTADNAATAAATAQTTANEAKTAAATAQTTANEAKTAAGDALTDAKAYTDKEVGKEKTRAEGKEAELNTAISNEVTRAKAAEQANATAIADMKDATIEGSLAKQIADEKTRADAAEKANATAIANEKTRAEGAEQTLTTNLAAEVTRATAAEAQALADAKTYTDTKLGATADGMYIAATNTVAENMTAIDNKLQDVQKITYDPTYKDTAQGSKIENGATKISGPVVISGETEGSKTITINSETGRIKGLSNTDWVTDPTLDGSSVAATQGQLYDIASKGFQVKTNNGDFNAPLATQISIVGDGTNITTSSAEGSRELKINLSDSPTFKEVNTSSKAGKQRRYNATTKEWEEVDVTTTTKFDGSGIYIEPSGSASGSANIVSLTASGLNNGRQQLKNIADGTDYTDAVTYKQLIAERIKIQGAGDAQVTFAPIIKEGTDIIEGTMYTITVTDKDTKPAGDGLTTSVSNGNVVSVKLAKAADGGAGSIIATEGENGGLTLNPVLTLNGGAQSLTFDATTGHISGMTNINWYERNDTYVPTQAASEGQLYDIVKNGIGLRADNAVETLPLNKTANILGGTNIATSIAKADENGNLNLTVSTLPEVTFDKVTVQGPEDPTTHERVGTPVVIDNQYVTGLKNLSFFANNPTNTVVVNNDTSATYLGAGNLPENVATSSKAATEAQLYDVVKGLDKADRYITNITTSSSSAGTTVTIDQNNAQQWEFTIPPTGGGGGGEGGGLIPHPDDQTNPVAPNDGNADNWYIKDGDKVYENTTLATMESTRPGKKSSVADITGVVDPLTDSTRDQVTAKITSMADAEGNVTYGQNYTIMDTAGNKIELSNLASASVLETVHSVVLNHDGRIRTVEDGFKLKAGTETPHEGDVKPGETLEFTGNVTSTNKNIKIDYDNAADKIDISVVDNPKFTSVEVAAEGGKKAIIDSTGISFDGNYYIGPNGLDANGKVISKVAPGAITDTSLDAVNGSQLYPVKKAVEDGFTVNGYKINLIGNGTEGFTIGAGKNIVVNTNGSATTIATSMTPEFTAVTVGDTTVEGSTPILINAANQGTIRNLKNTTWTLNQSVPYSGQAATEDQLAIVDSGLTNLGMNFVGDTEGASIHKNLGQTLKIVGGATTVTEEDNIRVDYVANDGNPYLKIGLAKNVNLTPDGSIIANDAKFDSDGLTVTNGANLGADQQVANYNESGMTIIRPANDSRHDLAFTDEYVSMGDNVITNVGSGLTLAPGQTTPNLNNAATVGDVMKLATSAEGDKNITVKMVDDPEVPGKKNAEISLNPTVKLGEDANEQIVLNGTTGNATIGKVNVNGAAGTITGLTNTTYAVQSKPGKGSNQAATQGQLYDIVDKTAGGWGLGADSGTATKQDIGKTLSVKGATVDGNKNITTKTTTAGVEVALNSRVELGTNDGVVLDGNNSLITTGTGDEYRISLNGKTGVISAGQKVSFNGNAGTGNVGDIQLTGTKDAAVITGLSNTEITWTKDTVLTAEQKSTAATQGQLKAYADSDTDWQLVANPAGGNYKVEASKVTLKVEDSKHTGTYKDVVIEDVASASNNVTNVAKNDAGDTITITQTINGTSNTVEFKNTNDYVVAGTYNMDENGDVTLARKDVNGTALDSVIIKDVAKKSDLDKVSNDYVKKVTVEGNSMTINQVVGGEAADPITFKNTNDYVVAGTYKVENGQVTLARKDADGKDIADVVITGIASSSDLENATLAYKANKGEAKTVKLSEGLDFTDGTNTTATVAADGVVTFDLKKEIDLGKDGSITVGGTEIKDKSVTVGDTTITGDSITTDEVNVGDNITIDGDKDQITIKGDETTTTITGDEIKVGDTSITGDNISTKEIVINGSKLISVEGPANLAGTDITRIKFADHVIATMEDGLKFSADKGNAVSKKLNETLPINGDGQYDSEGKLTKDGNIITQTTTAGGIQVTLNKDIDLGEKGSITIGDTTIDNGSVTTNEVNVGDTTINEDGVTTNNITVEGDTSNTVIDGDKITVGDNTTIEDGSITIKGDTNTTIIDGDKITLGDTIIEGDKITTNEIVIGGNSLLIEGSDIKTVYGDTINRIKYTDAQGNEQEVATMNDGLKFSADKGEVVNRKHNEILAIKGDGSVVTESDPENGEIKVGLADKITVGSDDATKVEIDGTKGTITTGDVTIDGANKEITVGDNTTIGDGTATFGDVTINEGDKGTINNLTNITWDKDYQITSGQAATEDQLKKVEEGIVEKGLDFAGDAGTDVHRDLGEKLNIVGGATDTTKLTDGNIGVVADGTDKLEIKLNSELTGLTKVQVGDVVIENNEISVGDNTTIGDGEATIGDITIDGNKKEISVGDNTTIGDGEATIGDITIDGNNKEITVGDNTTIGDGEATIGGVEIDGDNNTVTVGTGDNKVEIDGDEGTIKTGDVTIDGANNEITVGDNTTIGDGTATFGDVTINEGDKGTINNLTNITWDKDKITSGQAATEDQLKAVEEGITGKGLNFVGDDSKEIHKDLGETLTIKGGADTTKLTEGNIGVTNKEGALFVELAKDIKVDSVNVGDGATVLNKDGSATIGKVEISKDGDIDNGKIKLNADGSASIADGNFQVAANGDINSKYDGGTITADGNGFEVKHGDSSMKVDEAGTTISNGDSSTVINGDTINAGDNITINGGDGVVSITGADGAKADITVAKGDNNLAGDEQTRITYGDSQVATLADGMKYTDDNGVVLKRKLNENLNVLGGAKELTDGNIGVVAKGEDTLEIKLSKKLSGLEEIKVGENTTIKDGEITVGDTVIDKSSVTTETVNAKDVNADNVTVKETVKVGDKTTITGDTVKTETVNATTVKTGDTTINNDGMTINNGPTVTKTKVDVAGNKIENVAPGRIAADSTDAVNGSQLYDTNVKLNKLGDRVNKVGAHAAALAALHPLDFDPDEKLSVAAGVGHYHGSTAGAIGAFYRPDEKTMFSISGTVASHENMINAGVSFSLDRHPNQTNSKTAMAKQILDLTAKVNLLTQANDKMMNALRDASKNGGRVNVEFPDLPKDHWAYMYVQELAELGYLIGYPDGEYKGNRTLTRYEFATALYRALMNGAPVDDKMGRGMDEFKHELDNVAKAARFRVDRIAGQDNDRNKIERVRTNDKDDKSIPDYRDVYGSQIKPPAK